MTGTLDIDSTSNNCSPYLVSGLSQMNLIHLILVYQKYFSTKQHFKHWLRLYGKWKLRSRGKANISQEQGVFLLTLHELKLMVRFFVSPHSRSKYMRKETSWDL